MNYGSGNQNNALVVQEYLEKPLLMEGKKFDLRLYVLVKSLHPLKIFIYSEGLTRLATHDYEKAEFENFNNFYMHLTNYAINKNNPLFEENKTVQ